MGWGIAGPHLQMFFEGAAVSKDALHEGVAESMLKVKAVAGGYFASKSDFPDPRFVALRVKFRINASGVSKQQPLVLSSNPSPKGKGLALDEGVD